MDAALQAMLALLLSAAGAAPVLSPQLHRADELVQLVQLEPLAQLESRLQEPQVQLPRLPLPAQNLDAIKKLAQILIMLGQQVLSAEPGASPSKPPPHQQLTDTDGAG